MSKISLKEALQDYEDHMRDMQMLELAIAGGWNGISNVNALYQSGLITKKQIEDVITGHGGEIPKYPTVEELQQEIARLRQVIRDMNKRIYELDANYSGWNAYHGGWIQYPGGGM